MSSDTGNSYIFFVPFISLTIPVSKRFKYQLHTLPAQCHLFMWKSGRTRPLGTELISSTKCNTDTQCHNKLNGNISMFSYIKFANLQKM